jgi:TonB family protein
MLPLNGPIRSAKSLACLGLLLAVSLQAQAPPQTIQALLAKNFVGHVAILRDFYTNSELHFDATGHVEGTPHRGFGPIDGGLYVSRVSLKGNVLEIAGNAAIPVWDDGSDGVNWHSLPSKRTLKVDASQIADAVSAARLVDSILENPSDFGGACSDAERDEFKKIVRKGIGISYTVSAKADNETKGPLASSLDEVPRICFPTGEVAYKIAGGVTKPKPKHTPEPNYTPVGVRSHVTGKVDVMFIVNAAGEATSVLMLGKPLGAGLDEQTLSAMRNWRFDPATFQGKPVPVAYLMEFHFALRKR